MIKCMPPPLQPIPMGIIISVLMGIILTLPISSAAIAHYVELRRTGGGGGDRRLLCTDDDRFAVISG